MKFLRRLIGGSDSSTEQVETPWTVDQYLSEAVRVLELSWKLLHTADWRLEKQTSTGDVVHSATVPGVGKVFKAKGIVDMAPRLVLDLMFNHPEEFPVWNPVIVESRLLQSIDAYTHVSYQVTAERAGGLVARRDFINLSHWAEREGCLVVSGVSVPHPSAPQHNNYIRGENGPGCWVMRPVAGEPSRCLMEWYLNTNLRGWLPQYVVDTAFTSVMLDNLNNLRSHAQKQQQQPISQT